MDEPRNSLQLQMKSPDRHLTGLDWRSTLLLGAVILALLIVVGVVAWGAAVFICYVFGVAWFPWGMIASIVLAIAAMVLTLCTIVGRGMAGFAG